LSVKLDADPNDSIAEGVKSRDPYGLRRFVVSKRRLARIAAAAGLVLVLSAPVFAQAVSVQNRIPQQVIINGQRANGVFISAGNGGLQAFTCPNPQQYVTPDGASQGWTCFDQATGVWLLNALPPSSPSVQAVPAPVLQQPPTVIYQAPPTVIYQQPIPATVVYTTPAPVVVAPAYPSSVVLGVAAINATGRIVSAAVRGPRYSRVYYVDYGRGRGHRGW
jgi:hypothetical protein